LHSCRMTTLIGATSRLNRHEQGKEFQSLASKQEEPTIAPAQLHND
jgi:hypothetical protein